MVIELVIEGQRSTSNVIGLYVDLVVGVMNETRDLDALATDSQL